MGKTGPGAGPRRKLRWRTYRSAAGREPVREFLQNLTTAEFTVVATEMAVVRSRGLVAARHVEGDIYEVRAFDSERSFRVLFALEGHRGTILLSVHAFVKQSQKTPRREIALAQKRLADWRRRANR